MKQQQVRDIENAITDAIIAQCTDIRENPINEFGARNVEQLTSALHAVDRLPVEIEPLKGETKSPFKNEEPWQCCTGLQEAVGIVTEDTVEINIRFPSYVASANPKGLTDAIAQAIIATGTVVKSQNE